MHENKVKLESIQGGKEKVKVKIYNPFGLSASFSDLNTKGCYNLNQDPPNSIERVQTLSSKKF